MRLTPPLHMYFWHINTLTHVLTPPQPDLTPHTPPVNPSTHPFIRPVGLYQNTATYSANTKALYICKQECLVVHQRARKPRLSRPNASPHSRTPPTIGCLRRRVHNNPISPSAQSLTFPKFPKSESLKAGNSNVENTTF